jgi:hypothetical protein
MDKSKQMESVIVLVLGLIVLYLVKRREVFLVAAIGLGILSLLVPAMARAVHWGWSGLSFLLGEISGRLVLTVVYFVVLMPLALMARMTRRPAIRRRAGGNTYFKERNHRYNKEDLIHPW